MADFESIQKAKILASYNADDLIKGGKQAYIGEVRTWGDKKFVKHEDGWVHISNSGKHIIKNNSGVKPATEEHVAHAKKHLDAKPTRPIEAILEHMEPMIQNLLDKIAAEREAEGEKPLTDWQMVLQRLVLTHDLMKAVEKYTLPTDKMVKINSSRVAKGTITINAEIEREGRVHYLSTQAIYAGGYNIQAFHIRYLTDTNLPRTENTELTDEYGEKIKKLTKTQKLQSEIDVWEKRIQTNNELVAKNEKLSDEEIIEVLKNQKTGGAEYTYHDSPSWEEIVSRGADKNYDYDKSKYEASRAEYRQSRIDFWKRTNIDWKKEDNKTGEKELSKLRAKLEVLK